MTGDNQKRVYDVFLKDIRRHPDYVVTALEVCLQISNREAQDLVDKSPCMVLDGVEFEFAVTTCDRLNEVGAEAYYRARSTPSA